MCRNWTPSQRRRANTGRSIPASAHAAEPPASALQLAAGILNDGRKVAILAGAGALHATDELIEVAELLGAGIAKALLGKAAVPDELPFVTGAIGLRAPSRATT